MATMTEKRVAPRVVKMDTTKLKSNLGSLGRQLKGGIIEITKHGTVEAVIVAADQYRQLERRAGVDAEAVSSAEAQYDAMIATMQTSTHKAATDRIMSISGADLRATLDAHYDAKPPPVTSGSRASKRIMPKAGSSSTRRLK